MMNSMCRSTDSAGVHVSSTDTTGDTESCSLYSRDLSKCLASTILCTDSIDYKLSSANNSSDSLIVPSSCVSKEKLNNPSAGDVSSTDLTVDLPLSTHREEKGEHESSNDSPVESCILETNKNALNVSSEADDREDASSFSNVTEKSKKLLNERDECSSDAPFYQSMNTTHLNTLHNSMSHESASERVNVNTSSTRACEECILAVTSSIPTERNQVVRYLSVSSNIDQQLNDRGHCIHASTSNMPLDMKIYSTRKTIAQGMLDICLLLSNATQLKYALQSASKNHFIHVSVTSIIISILLQVLLGILLIFQGRWNITFLSDQRKIDIINNIVITLTFLVTVVNIMASVFTPTDHSSSSEEETVRITFFPH